MRRRQVIAVFTRASIAMLSSVACLVAGCATQKPSTRLADETFPGTVQAVARWTLTFDIPGALTEQLVAAGDGVVSGQGLGLLREEEYASRVRDTQAGLKDAIDRSEATRTQLTSDDLKVVSPAVTVVTEPVALRERVLQAIVNTAKADIEARQAQWARGATVLRADRSGTVVRWLAQAGDAVSANAPVVELEDDSRLKVVATVPKVIANSARVGQRAEIEIGESDPRSFDAIVRAIESDDAPAGAALIVLEVIERATLKKGSTARIKLLRR